MEYDSPFAPSLSKGRVPKNLGSSVERKAPTNRIKSEAERVGLRQVYIKMQ